MTNNYFTRLKFYCSTSLCFLLTRKTLSISLPLPKLHFSSFPPHPTTPQNPNESSSSREGLFNYFLKRCSTMMDLKQIHAQIIQSGFDQNLFVVGKIITFCAVSEDVSMDYALSVFKQIKSPDGFVWNTMIRGIGKTSDPIVAFGYYKRMLDMGEKADNFTYCFLLKICGQLSAIDLGKQVHCSTLKNGLDSHVFVRNTLIHMYGMFKDFKTARHLFEEILIPDVVSWNTIIDCYVCCSKYEEALQLFLRMQQSGFEPDDATLVVILSACSYLGALDFGMWVHSLINGTGLDQMIAVSNSLVDMYAKCGSIAKARLVFNKMDKRNLVSWNSMILGLAMHGYAYDVFDLFSEMQELKLETPDNVTFLAVLCACSHCGLVKEGRKYFASMSRDYHIQPTIKHYGCMVDLLGRAGFVEEAYELIMGMPMKCNAIVWRALLGACRVHGHLKLGEKVTKHLAELEPNHSGDYVLLAQMYGNRGRWNEMQRVREVMRGRQIQKPEPGNSLIEIDPSVWLEESTGPCYKTFSSANTTLTHTMLPG